MAHLTIQVNIRLFLSCYNSLRSKNVNVNISPALVSEYMIHFQNPLEQAAYPKLRGPQIIPIFIYTVLRSINSYKRKLKPQVDILKNESAMQYSKSAVYNSYLNFYQREKGTRDRFFVCIFSSFLLTNCQDTKQ